MSILVIILPLPLLRGPHRLTGPATKPSQAASSSPETPAGSPKHGPLLPPIMRAAPGQHWQERQPVKRQSQLQLPLFAATRAWGPAHCSPSMPSPCLTVSPRQGSYGFLSIWSGSANRRGQVEGSCYLGSGSSRGSAQSHLELPTTLLPAPGRDNGAGRTEPGVRRAVFSVPLVCLLAPLDLGGLQFVRCEATSPAT